MSQDPIRFLQEWMGKDVDVHLTGEQRFISGVLEEVGSKFMLLRDGADAVLVNYDALVSMRLKKRTPRP